MKTFNLSSVALAQAILLASGATFCAAEVLFNGDTTTCATVYKDAQKAACASIQSDGNVTGCVTAGDPTLTGPTGRATVTITAGGGANGDYNWVVASSCTPSPTNCDYRCKKRARGNASVGELEHAEAIEAFGGALTSLFEASGTSAVNAAIIGVDSALVAVPLGPNYDENSRTEGRAEVNALSGGSSSVIASDLPITVLLEAKMNDDSLALFGDDPTTPTVSEWGLMIMALLGLAAGTIVFDRRRRSAAA